MGRGRKVGSQCKTRRRRIRMLKESRIRRIRWNRAVKRRRMLGIIRRRRMMQSRKNL